MKLRSVTLLFLLIGISAVPAQTVLIDFGSDTTYRGVTAPSPDTNGNHWNSTAFGFIGNLVDSTGASTTIDWAPDGLGDVDSFNSYDATSDPVTAMEIAVVQTTLDSASVGDFDIAEAAMDYYVSNNGTSNVGRFQLQQLDPLASYELSSSPAIDSSARRQHSVFLMITPIPTAW